MLLQPHTLFPELLFTKVNPEYTPINAAFLCQTDFMFMGFRLFMAHTKSILSILGNDGEVPDS